MLIRPLGSESWWQGNIKAIVSTMKPSEQKTLHLQQKTLLSVTYGSLRWKPRCFRQHRWYRVVWQPACMVRTAHVACSEPRLCWSCKMQQDSQKCLGLMNLSFNCFWALQVQKSSTMVNFFSIPTFSYINHTGTVTQFKKLGPEHSGTFSLR